MIVMIILLILCLPLILMLSLYTTTSIVAVNVDVPVSGIVLSVEETEMIELDLDKGESFTVEYAISPTEASNKAVRFLFEKTNSDVQLAEFSVDGNTLTPTRAGAAKVTVETLDGAYRDSFFIRVKTNSVSAINSAPTSENITVGQTASIDTVFYPSTAKNRGLSYRVVDGLDVATVDRDGLIKGIGIGKAKIEVSSTDNPEAVSTFEIEVNSSGVMDFVNSKATLSALQNPSGEFVMVLNPELTFTAEPTVEIFDVDGNPVSPSVITASADPVRGRVLYEVIDRLCFGTFEIRVTLTPDGGEPHTKSCYVEQVKEISAEWYSREDWTDGEFFVPRDKGEKFDIDLKPLGADVIFRADLVYAQDYTEETLTLTAGETYMLRGEYLMLQVQNSSEGACLRVLRNADKSVTDPDLSKVTVRLSIIYRDGEGEKIIHLDEFTVFALPG